MSTPSWQQSLAHLREVQERLRKGTNFDFAVSFPITRVDAANRTVEGEFSPEAFAGGDELTFDAARDAFTNFGGSVCEMGTDRPSGALTVAADDAQKKIVVRAKISSAAQDVWHKLTEGVLKFFACGAVRERAVLTATGRRTTKMRVSAMSLTDMMQNPAENLSLAKATGGVIRASAVLAGKGEPMVCAASLGLEKISRTLAAGVRPLQEELGSVLAELAREQGTPALVVNSTQARDYAQLGPATAKQLLSLAKGLEAARGAADRKKIAKAAELVLSGFVHEGRRASAAAITATELHSEAAAALSKLTAPSSLASRNEKEAYDDLAAGVFKTAELRKSEGVEAPPDLTLEELRKMESDLKKQIEDWHAAGRQQSGYPDGPAYERLTREYFKISNMVKQVEGSAMRPWNSRRRH